MGKGGLNLYGFVSNSPLNRVDPLGEDDDLSPWLLGWEWLTGTGPQRHDFVNGDNFTELLKQHQHIENVRNKLRKQPEDECAKCDSSSLTGNDPYRLNGLEGIPKYLQDYSTLLTGGLTGNLAVTFFGSYQLPFAPVVALVQVDRSVSAAEAVGAPLRRPRIPSRVMATACPILMEAAVAFARRVVVCTPSRLREHTSLTAAVTASKFWWKRTTFANSDESDCGSQADLEKAHGKEISGCWPRWPHCHLQGGNLAFRLVRRVVVPLTCSLLT